MGSFLCLYWDRLIAVKYKHLSPVLGCSSGVSSHGRQCLSCFGREMQWFTFCMWLGCHWSGDMERELLLVTVPSALTQPDPSPQGKHTFRRSAATCHIRATKNPQNHQMFSLWSTVLPTSYQNQDTACWSLSPYTFPSSSAPRVLTWHGC